MGSRNRSVTTGYQYYGSVAQVVCMGPVDTLHAIYNGETLIYEGPVYRADADADGKTILSTNIGTIRFYWGTGTQNVDSLLNALTLDLGSGPATMPASNYKNVVYAVLDDVAFGSQVVPPTLQFHLTRKTSGLTLAAHDIDEDAVLPEAIYEILTNTLWGLGLSASQIDTLSFEAAATTLIAEGLGVSPFYDATTTIREMLGKLYPYADLVLYWDAGKLYMKLIRLEDSSSAEVINEDDLLDEPRPDYEGFNNTWNFTTATFNDRGNLWEESSESYDNPANAAVQGERVDMELDFPFVTSRPVAKKLARRKGIAGGMPIMTWRLKLKPAWKTLTPGDLIKLSFAKFGISNLVCRVMERTIGGAEDPAVEVECLEEATRAETYDYDPPSDTFGVGDTYDSDGNSAFTLQSTTARLLWMPDGILDGKQDGFVVAMNKPSAATDGAKVFFTWDPNQKPYREVGVQMGFPAKGQILHWHRLEQGGWIVRVQFDTDEDYDTALVLDEDETEIYLVTARRTWKTEGATTDEHQVDGVWLMHTKGGYFTVQGSNQIDIEVDASSAFDAESLALETEAGEGNYPCLHVYFGRQEDFFMKRGDRIKFMRDRGNAPWRWVDGVLVDPDDDRVRYFKTAALNARDEQDPAILTAVTFDRNYTDMCPEGTYSRQWGAVVKTTYEQFDYAAGAEVLEGTHPDYDRLEDCDIALFNILHGIATTDERVIWDHLDTVEGTVLTLGRSWYNSEG